MAGASGSWRSISAEIPPRTLARLPFTTWRRLQRLVDGRDTVALLLATAPLSRSARGLTVQLSAAAATTPVWHGTSARARRLVALRLTPRILAARRLPRTATSDE